MRCKGSAFLLNRNILNDFFIYQLRILCFSNFANVICLLVNYV